MLEGILTAHIKPQKLKLLPNSKLMQQSPLFKDLNFGGACRLFGIGEYDHDELMGYAESASSAIVGDEVSLCACTDSGFGGVCESYQNKISRFDQTNIGNDHLYSMKVQLLGARCVAANPPPTPQIQTGYSNVTFWNCRAQRDVLKIWYHTPELGRFVFAGSVSTNLTGNGFCGVGSPLIANVPESSRVEFRIKSTPCVHDSPEYIDCQVEKLIFQGNPNGDNLVYNIN